MESFLLALSLVFAGTQNPKDLPGPEYQYPILDPWGVWEPGSGGGGGKKTGCYITKEHSAPPFWCVRYNPNPQTNKYCDLWSADAAERWKDANCR